MVLDLRGKLDKLGAGGTPSKISAFFLGFYVLSFWPVGSCFVLKTYRPEGQSLYFKQLAPDGVAAWLETHCCLFLFRLAPF